MPSGERQQERTPDGWGWFIELRMSAPSHWHRWEVSIRPLDDPAWGRNVRGHAWTLPEAQALIPEGFEAIVVTGHPAEAEVTHGRNA